MRKLRPRKEKQEEEGDRDRETKPRRRKGNETLKDKKKETGKLKRIRR